MAFSNLGNLSYVPIGLAKADESFLANEALTKPAEKHGKTAAQIALRWGVQRGTTIIPKSTNLQRLAENLDLFGFELSEEEMGAISALNCDRRFNDTAVFTGGALNYFYPTYA